MQYTKTNKMNLLAIIELIDKNLNGADTYFNAVLVVDKEDSIYTIRRTYTLIDQDIITINAEDEPFIEFTNIPLETINETLFKHL